MVVPISVSCPYCGESFETAVDISGGDQEYIEDCQVCCQPIIFRVATDADGELLRVETQRDDE
jgi:Cysteine-rich CPXCG